MAGKGFFSRGETRAKLSDAAFRTARDRLRMDLVELQQTIRATAAYPVIVVIAGVQGAGVVDSLNLLNTWMDPRWIRTHAFDAPSDEERERPAFWRYWRSLPVTGAIGLYLDGWYGDAIGLFCKHGNRESFDTRLKRIAAFEQTLAADGALIVKVWLHLSKGQQRRKLDGHRDDTVFGFRASDTSAPQPAPYDAYVAAAARALRATGTKVAPWHIVAGADDNHRRAQLLTILRDAMQIHVDARAKHEKAARKSIKRAIKADKKNKPHAKKGGTLAKVDLSKSLSDAAYAKAFHARQARLYELQKAARTAGISTIVAFEGWDASGKGGAIRRLSYALSARNYKVVPIAAPNDEEKEHHYLWRFWRHLSRAGHITLFDRTWYGRVLVERVENLLAPEAWARGYGEINEFEEQLAERGIVLVKFWLHIDKDEQLRRFKDREKTPYKRWKITEDDWRNRKNWERYEIAVNDMIAATSTKVAPWRLVPANDKHFARIMIFDQVIAALESALGRKQKQDR